MMTVKRLKEGGEDKRKAWNVRGRRDGAILQLKSRRKKKV